MNDNPTCELCGGPHHFDTSIDSVAWNKVIRANNFPDYLCLTCIKQIFNDKHITFTAHLYGAGFTGEHFTFKHDAA